MMEMIAIYLKQTPPLVYKMKLGLSDKDWNSLFTAVHKLIPSFTIMGINKDYETMARKIQELTRKKEHLNEVQELVLQIENVCTQPIKELKEEYNLIKKANK